MNLIGKLNTQAFSSRSAFSTFPNGWFVVALSKDIPPGKIRALRYFGKDFILFRTKNGTPHILNAHCPHLGAHLGYGGRVEGEAIQCPFHGWKFGGNGQCIDVPYTNKIPPKAQIPTWLVHEVNGLILMYHHTENIPPQWNIPNISEYTSGEWTELRFLHQWKVRTNIAEYGENSYDTAHFSFVHSKVFNYAKSEFLEVNGSTLIHQISVNLKPSFAAKVLGVENEFPIKITRYGSGYEIFHVSLKGKINIDWIYLFLTTPIDEEYIEVRLLFSMKTIVNQAITSLIAKIINSDVKEAQDEDITIWENKIYCSDPILCDGDGPIMKYRRWVSQFYSDKLLIND
ncbi:Rieske 2Fe-2S domain-containing protein [Nostoc sp. C117]|uniref:Rieske 2Fe-2S domain-containing protein n=1 Tax=Nostoc sp. C117 TaxID=3349875 RepID=UPI00370D87D2